LQYLTQTYHNVNNLTLSYIYDFTVTVGYTEWSPDTFQFHGNRISQI